MRSSDAYARIVALDVPALSTSEVAAALRISTKAASQLLVRLSRAGLATRVRHGLWAVRQERISRYALAEQITAPFPSYISMQSALYLHGMIEQVPAVIYVASLARTQRLRTSAGVYSVHHLAPELFGGFETRPDGTKLATPEKALFDIAYLSGGRSRLFRHVPELEIPSRFSRSCLFEWTQRISAERRRSMVEARLREMGASARPAAETSRRTSRATRGTRADRKRG